MAASYLDYFIHAANILLLAAHSVRDILWLRVLAVAGCGSMTTGRSRDVSWSAAFHGSASSSATMNTNWHGAGADVPNMEV